MASPNLPAFVKPTEDMPNELSETQKLAGNWRLSDVVGGLLVRHSTAYYYVPHTREKGVVLTLPESKTTSWDVEARLFEKDEAIVGSLVTTVVDRPEITIQRTVDGNARDRIRYYIGRERIVRRQDYGDVYEKRQLEQSMDEAAQESIAASGAAVNGPDSIRMLEISSKTILQASHNSLIEYRLGVNFRAVDLEELDGLRDFLEQPGFIPKRLDD